MLGVFTMPESESTRPRYEKSVGGEVYGWDKED